MPLTRPPGPSVRPEGESLPGSSGAAGAPPGAPPGREATPLEQAMLVRALREPEAGVDVEQIVAELPDAPDPRSIERGFRRAVERWPSLTGFLRWEGLPAPRRETLPAGPVPFERHDWRALGKGEREERFLAWLRADRRRGFRLDRPPLLRVALFEMGEGLRMVWTFHHLIADGRSFEPVLAEVLRAAPDLAFENAPVVESRAPFPADGAREFWMSRLAGFEGPTPLAATRDSATRDEPAEPGETVRRLSARTSAALAALAARPKLSASAIVAGAWAILLARTSGEDDVVFGSVSSGRRREDAGKVGLFIRTLPTRARVPDKGAVLPWLEELRAEQLEARAHEAVSLPEISSWLGRPGDVPLFETLVVFDREPLGTGLARRGGVWERRSFRLVEKTGEAVTVYATAEPEWVVRLAWDRSRFDAAGGDRLADALVQILETIASEGEAADFSRLSLASPEERRRVIFEWNATDVDVPEADARGAAAAIEEQARKTPERTAVVCGDERVSYARLDALAERAARAFVAAGVERGGTVGICAERSIAMLAGLLGAWKAGAAYVPLDPDYPAERLAFLAEDAGLQAIATTSGAEARLPRTAARTVMLDALGPAEKDEEEEPSAAAFPPGTPARAGAESLAYVLYTSGSTGRPKGVLVTHGNLANFFAGMDGVLGKPEAAEPGVWLATTSISFDISVLELFWTLARGFTVILPPVEARSLSLVEPRGDVSPHASIPWLVRQHGVTHFQCTPTFARMLVLEEDSSRSLASLAELLVGGEALSSDLAESLLAAGAVSVRNMYGPTETTVWSTAARVRAGEPVVIGRPIANTRAYVLDPAGQPLPPGFPGELHIAGEGVARGYRNRPDLTAGRFLPDRFAGRGRMYRTGDRARWRADGQLEFLGRFDDQVKIRGHRVEPAEIESALARHSDVREAAVVAQEADGERRLVAFVAVSGTPPPSVAELREWLRGELPEAMLPASFVFVGSLPRTPNGKLDRRALPAAESATRGAGADDRPRTEVEAELCRVWSRLLRVEEVGIRESFFDLGGHSLLALQLLARVKERFGADVPLKTLFDAPTVAEFAPAVERALAPAALEPLGASGPGRASREERFAPFPLTETQQAYWIGRSEGFELGNVATHTYVELDLPHFDLARAQSALDRLIARHDMLRARILPDGRQQVLESVPSYRIEVLDLRGVDEDQADAQLDRTRRRLSTQAIPAGRWPLFDVRATLLEGCVRVHLTVDHLIVDALSWRTLQREFRHFYRRGASPLPELAFTFREYVLGEAGLRDSESYRRARSYWQARLQTLPPAPDLPLAKSPASVARPRMTRRKHHLAPAAWRRFKARARRTGLTATGALLASFADVLSSWSRSRDRRMTINVPTFRRKPVHPQVGDVVGVFTSLTLLEVQNGDGTFEERARRIQRQLWDDLDHSDYPGVEVIRDVARARGASGSALFPVVFTSLLFASERDRDAVPDGEPSGEAVFEINQAPQVSISAEVAEHRGGLTFLLDAVGELFPAGLLDDLFGAWGSHLRELSRDPAAWQRDSAATASALLPEWQAETRLHANATDAPVSDMRLEELFEASLRGGPDRVAVVAADRELTYRELDLRAESVARRLRAAGVSPGALVAVAMEKGWEQAVAVLAILRAGAAYLPVEPELPAQRLRYLLTNAGVAVALTTSSLEDRFDFPAGVEAIAVDEEPPAAPGPRALSTRRSPDELAYVLYTSGSTGVPKGVAITHRGAVNTVLDVNERFGVGPDDRILGLSALGFDLSVYDLFGAFAAGGAVVLPDEASLRDPARWLEPILRGRVTIWDSVPALMKLFVESLAARSGGVAPGVAERLRLVLLSGDWTPVSLPAQVRSVFPDARIVSLGGATEASIWSILHEIDGVDPSWRSIPYGLPMKNQRFHVLNADLAPCPVWVPGDLYIAGIGLAQGYLGDPEKTGTSFFEHPRTGERLYRTGDLGRYLPDGRIEFLGREDHQVKVLGTRIELGEIEAVVAAHPSVAAAVVTARGEWNRHLCAYIVAKPGANLSAAELAAHLSERLPEAMLPRSFMVLARLPLTANGKVDRASLPAPVETLPVRAAEASAPSLPAAGGEDPAARVAAGVAAILRLPSVRPDDNLIELGANSVDFIRIANLVEKAFGRRPALHDLYREPFVSAMTRPGAGVEDEIPMLLADAGAGDPWESPE